MKLHRRRVLALAGATLAAPLLPRVSQAQAAYPARPVRVIVATAAGATGCAPWR